MTPREFILHWHREARMAPPRFLPPMWERHADELIGKGITAEDLTLVAKWMLTQLARSQQGERNAVAFNAASFGWVKIFGEWGASNQDANFLGKLTLAEAARKPVGKPVQKAGTAAAQAMVVPQLSEDDRARGDAFMREFCEREARKKGGAGK